MAEVDATQAPVEVAGTAVVLELPAEVSIELGAVELHETSAVRSEPEVEEGEWASWVTGDDGLVLRDISPSSRTRLTSTSDGLYG
jgi:hypothetical protein